jgi:FixJ family two-component response regulator
MMIAAKVVAVVDDEAAMRKAIVRLLGANGFVTRDYPSAEAFLKCKAARESACLVLDINLGGMSGIELQRRLKASGSPIPVIFITAADDEGTKAEAMRAGCAGFLRKPFPASVLIGTIAKATQ